MLTGFFIVNKRLCEKNRERYDEQIREKEKETDHTKTDYDEMYRRAI